MKWPRECLTLQEKKISLIRSNTSTAVSRNDSIQNTSVVKLLIIYSDFTLR